MSLQEYEPEGELETPGAERARSRAERAHALAERSGDPGAIAGALHALGTAQLDGRDYAAAEKTLQLALERGRGLGDDGVTVDVLRGLLRCAYLTQQYDVAITRAMQALHVAEALGDEARTATVHNDLGLLYGTLGDFEGSLDHLLAGLRLRRAAGAAEDGSLLNNLGNVYLELKDDRQALGYYQAAQHVAAAQGTVRLQAIVLGNLGRVHARLGEHPAALDAFRRSAELFELSGDQTYLGPALARLGAAHAAVGDHGEARAYLERGLTMVEQTGQREFLDEVLTAAGTFHLACGEVRTAINLLRRALAVVPSDETTARVQELHRVLAEAYERAGELPAALRHLKAYQRVSQAVAEAASRLRIRKLMVELEVERARQQEEIFRLKNVALASAYEELRVLHEQIEARNRELERVSIEDGLTGVFNRRYLDLQLPHELSRARRRERTLSIAMCDIDHFKEINDRFSHAVGDEVLRHLGRLFQSATREEDVVCRYGGEEFVVLMPETDLAGASGLVERLRGRLAEQPWAAIHPELRVTISVGLVEASPGVTAEALLAEADTQLYWAKRRGRDRVERRDARVP